jgi:thioredoxin reductase (NADPH)
MSSFEVRRLRPRCRTIFQAGSWPIRKSSCILKSEVTALLGGDRLEQIVISNRVTSKRQESPTRALFVMVGAAPNTAWLKGLVQLDDKGFVQTGTQCGQPDSPYATSMSGIFAVGDVRAGSVKRVASAVGEGSVVVSKVWEHVRRD